MNRPGVTTRPPSAPAPHATAPLRSWKAEKAAPSFPAGCRAGWVRRRLEMSRGPQSREKQSCEPSMSPWLFSTTMSSSSMRCVWSTSS